MPLRNSKREPRDRRREIPIGGKIRNFRPTSRCIMETVQERAVVTMECWLEVLRSLSNRAISDDLEWPRNVTSAAKHLSMAYISTAYVAYDRPSTGEVLLKVICGHVRDGTGSVTLTRDPTRPGTPVTRDPVTRTDPVFWRCTGLLA